MSLYYLTFTLHSDTAFGRGDGVAGFLDQEVQHDAYGCPYLGGKALKGLLVNECADILDALPPATQSQWTDVARTLFGEPGGTHATSPLLQIGDAQLPADLRSAIKSDIDSERPSLTRAAVLDTLTALRRQTAIDNITGVAKGSSLRTIRVILRETTFAARLHLPAQLDGDSTQRVLMLLAACAKALRRAGTSRNRGLGRLKAVELCDAQEKPITSTYFERFCQEVQS